jgi:uncharacterized protein (TIGR02996 family)
VIATDQAAFLDAIRAEPADDTPRLVYADWLEEHGGQPERAEFIRVQVELAKLPKFDGVTLRGQYDLRSGNRALDLADNIAGTVYLPEYFVEARLEPSQAASVLRRASPTVGMLGSLNAMDSHSFLLRFGNKIARAVITDQPQLSRSFRFRLLPQMRDGQVVHFWEAPDPAERLRRREGELLAGTLGDLRQWEWFGKSVNNNRVKPTFQRGFVAKVTCPLSAWVGDTKCAVGPTVAATQPIEHVTCPGIVRGSRPAIIFRGMAEGDVPPDVWSELGLDAHRCTTGWCSGRSLVMDRMRECSERGTHATFDAREAGEEALSDMLIRWARRHS